MAGGQHCCMSVRRAEQFIAANLIPYIDQYYSEYHHLLLLRASMCRRGNRLREMCGFRMAGVVTMMVHTMCTRAHFVPLKMPP